MARASTACFAAIVCGAGAPPVGPVACSSRLGQRIASHRADHAELGIWYGARLGVTQIVLKCNVLRLYRQNGDQGLSPARGLDFQAFPLLQ